VSPTLRQARRIWSSLLDLVYPPQCLLCGAYDEPVVCGRCHAAFAPIPEPVCGRCGRPGEEGSACRNCQEASAHGGWGFDAARAGGIYWGPLREGIHRLKFQKQELLGPALGAHLANRCLADGLLTANLLRGLTAVVPVPLHRSRERQRGYNQARLLAVPLAEMLGAPLLTDGVVRTVRTPPQVGSSGEARRRNVTPQAFRVDEPDRVRGQGILLVDDVFTTGATVSACASALRQAGAAKIVAVTLAAGG
jgi:ComF family protein